MVTKYFTKVLKSIVELKAEYRTLCKTHHPDKGGDSKVFVEILDEYERLGEQIIKSAKQTTSKQLWQKMKSSWEMTKEELDKDRAIRMSLMLRSAYPMTIQKGTPVQRVQSADLASFNTWSEPAVYPTPWSKPGGGRRPFPYDLNEFN